MSKIGILSIAFFLIIFCFQVTAISDEILQNKVSFANPVTYATGIAPWDVESVGWVEERNPTIKSIFGFHCFNLIYRYFFYDHHKIT